MILSTDLSETENEVIDLFVSAYHALRSYEFGNSSPDIASAIADKMEKFLPFEVPTGE